MKSKIPWIHRYDWDQVIQSITTIGTQVSQNNKVKDLVDQLTVHFSLLDDEFSLLCAQSCPSCKDVCCKKATVWFDLKDLLYIYFSTRKLPSQQIDRDGQGLCRQLSDRGCRLARRERPYICSWYICPTQRKILQGDERRKIAISTSLSEMKKLREKLESLYISDAL